VPTTVVKSVGTSSRDYALLASWEAAAPTDLTLTRSSVTVTGSTSSTIMLDALASSTADFYVGHAVWADARPAEKRLITAYDGTTKVATIGILNGSSATWDNIPAVEAYTIDSTIWRGECYNDTEFTSTSALLVDISGSTASSSCYKELTAAAGQSFSDNTNVQTNALRYNQTNGVGLYSSASYTDTANLGETFARISKLQFYNHRSNGGTALRINASAALVDKCICESTLGAMVAYSGSTQTVISNSLLVTRSTGGYAASFSQNISVYNCTLIVSVGIGAGTFTTNYGGIILKNCALFNCSVVKGGAGSATFTTCYTDVASPPTGCTTVAYDTSTGSGFQNITDATRDFRIKSTSGLIDVGTTDATNAPIDIAGTARPSGASYDIGAWEYLSPYTQPNADIAVNYWAASSGVSLYAMVDEPVASDSDYITSPLLDGDQQPAIMSLNPALAAGSYTIHARADQTGSGRQLRVTLLDASGNSVGSSSWQSVTGSFATYDLSVTTTGTATRVKLEAQ